jgi:hypothetical protein
MLEDRAVEHAARKAAREAWSWNLHNDTFDAVKPVTVFISYSHHDIAHREALDVALATLKRQRVVETWTDQEVAPGDEWNSKIREALKRADIVVFLVSPDFIASDYITDIEVREAFERHQTAASTVVPIIVRPTEGWACTPIGEFQALPTGLLPVTLWDDKDRAWEDVAHGIRRVAMRLAAKRCGT